MCANAPHEIKKAKWEEVTELWIFAQLASSLRPRFSASCRYINLRQIQIMDHFSNDIHILNISHLHMIKHNVAILRGSLVKLEQSPIKP